MLRVNTPPNPTKAVTGEVQSVYQRIYAAQENPVIDSSFYVISLVDKIQLWGIERNITVAGGATALSQIAKLKKELLELEAGLQAGDDKEVKDGIGDCLVVLAQIARLYRTTWDECLEQSWNDIKDRKGEMHCGIFVKQVTLDKVARLGVRDKLLSCETAEEVESLFSFVDLQP